MKAVAKAEKRLREFDARGSLCPICRQQFRHCGHSIGDARVILQRRVVEQIVERRIRQASNKQQP